MTPDGKVGLGFFGYGFMSEAHLAGLDYVEDGVALGICGPNLERARATAAQHGVDFVTTDPAELLSVEGLDGVVIATPDHTHYPLTMESINAGRHVFVEKPIASNAGQGREMYAGVKSNNLRSMVGFTLRANPLVQQVRRMIDDGEIGEILSIHAERYNSSMLEGSPKRNWKTDPLSTATGVVGDLGSHAIDLIQFWAGPISRVAAALETHVKHGIDDASGEAFPLELDDEASLLVEFASGARGVVITSRVGLVDSHKPLGRSNFTLNGTKFGFVTDGIMEARRHRPGHDPEVVDPRLPLGEADHAGVLAFFGERMMRNFVTSIKEERDIAPTLADGLRTQEVIDAAVEAAKRGVWLDVPQVQ